MSIVHRYTKQQITDMTINQSTSKQMFTFSKSPRFPSTHRKGFCDTFYTLPSLSSTRSASIGYGTKYDFTRDSKGKNPEFYGVKRDFDPNNTRGLRFSFGINRDAYGKVYCDTNKIPDKSVPGPGKYNVRTHLGENAPKYSMLSRFHMNGRRGRISDLPGPGAYENSLCITEVGRYPLSTVKNTTSMNFGLTKSQRFNYKYGNTPGPNAYPLKSLMGANFNSKYKSNPGMSLYGRFRETTNASSKYPGPGDYNVFSEIGMYVSKGEQKKKEKKKKDANKESTKKTTSKNESEPEERQNTKDNQSNPKEEDNNNNNNNNEQTYEEQEVNTN